MAISTPRNDDPGRSDVGRAWSSGRLPSRGLHLDSAAAGRCSTEAMRAAADHAALEAQAGAYVAEAQAEPVLAAARSALAGLLGIAASGLAFVESASVALATLLQAWPLREGDTVAVVPSEWGPNLAAFADNGLRVTELATDTEGLLDLDQLKRVLADDPPAFVHLTQVASHRPLVQPVSQAAALCHAAGIPLWVDAAQALGHVDTATGADVSYATSRKWMAGPRGVGMLAIAEPWWDRLRIAAPALRRSTFPSDLPVVQLLESREANIAGRVGLAVAVRQHLDAGPAQIRQRLRDVARMTAEVLAGLTGWHLVGPAGGLSAIAALRPTCGQDVAATRSRLLGDHQILTTCAIPARAPREMTGPLLRVSPHVDCTREDLERLRSALA
jgi:pyridoxal 5-phosphate dependent beta-lyase